MHSIFSWFYWSFRSVVKVLLRHITKLCELQRICYNTLAGADRSMQIEYSLVHSKQGSIKTMTKYLDKLSTEQKLRLLVTEALHYSIMLVLNCKKINTRAHPSFVKSFSRCIEHIWGYKQLKEEVALLASIAYDSDNEEHESKLLKLWNLLRPDTPLNSRISKQWQEIGFQGNDPKTDFRGMGILGLVNLLYFAQEYNNQARHVLLRSLHPTSGYSFAILGINITHMSYRLLQDGTAKAHFYNVSHHMPNVDVFHRFYCYLFVEFDKFWVLSKPTDVMDFSNVRQNFEKLIRESLKDINCIFTIKKVENV